MIDVLRIFCIMIFQADWLGWSSSDTGGVGDSWQSHRTRGSGPMPRGYPCYSGNMTRASRVRYQNIAAQPSRHE